MKRIVIDTNTLISALGWKKGNPRKVLDSVFNEKNKLIESKETIDEYDEVVSREKFDFITKEEKQEFKLGLLRVAEIVEPKTKVNLIKADPDDNMFLECASEGKADYIISGNDHLLKQKEFNGIKIVTPREFVELKDED